MNEIGTILRIARAHVNALGDQVVREAEDAWNESVEMGAENQEEAYKYYCGVIDGVEQTKMALDEMVAAAGGKP